MFHPIGFNCPVSLSPKLSCKQCFIMTCEWDQGVPEDVRKSFLLWLQDLPIFKEVKIPQWLMGIADRVLSCSLHIFCGTSKAAYVAAVFFRLEYNSCVKVQLIQAKFRVAPIKRVIIHRLELLAETMGARLAASTRKEFEQENVMLSFWSDSSAVITWIKREDQWGVFVWNRVQEIRRLTSK